MEIGNTYKVLIDSYDVNGYGVAHIDKKIVFVEGAMEGEEVICEITNSHKKYAFAKVNRILQKSDKRIESLCPYSEYCGGCDLLYMDYSVEASIKENKVKQTLRKFKDVKYNSLIKPDNIYGYRNKVMVPFQRDEEDDVISGFYEKKSHNIIPMEKCIISADLDNKILHFIKGYLSLFHISICNEQKHEGIFREVMIRHTSLNEYMIVLVVTKEIDFSNLVNLLTKEFKEIKSIYLNINPDKTNVVLSNDFKLLYGNKVIIENILGLSFEVSASSFMQVNHKQCERLYQEAFRMANLNSDMNVIDAYCGMGSITLNIAKNVNHVYGIEVVESAIINANKNKELNNISNATFICGKCEDEIVKLVNKEKIDVIFFDPPRKGCDEKFLSTVVSMNIPKIVYISCNVATMARDIGYLENKGYKLLEATPVDLFSRTSHVEVVTLLELKTDKNK